MRAKHTLISLAGAIVLGNALSAQTPPPAPITLGAPNLSDLLLPVGVGQGQVPGQGPEQGQNPATPAVALDPVKAAAAAKAAMRMQAFKKLVFDRRPSSILKAWAAPELKPYDPKEEEKKDGNAGSGDAGAGDAGSDNAGAAPIEGVEPSTIGVPGKPGGMVSLTRPRAVSSSTGVIVTGTFLPSTPAVRLMTPVTVGAPSTAARPVGGSGMTPAQIQALLDAELNGGTAATSKLTGPATAATAVPAVSAVDAALEAKKLKREMEMLQRDVTLGRWGKLAEFLASLPEKDQVAAYEHVLTVLPLHPNKPGSNLPSNLQERNSFSFEEALVLAGMAPKGFDKKQTKKLAPIVQRAIQDGSVVEELIRLLGVEVSKPKEAMRMDRREVAMLLSDLKKDVELGVFLPTVTEAEENDDREAMNLRARYALAMYAKDRRSSWLEEAWYATQGALAKGDIGKVEKEEALRRAVDLAPKVSEELGPAWLAGSFTARPARGMEILATIGGQVATGFQQKGSDTEYRAAGLELQKTAVEALLRVAPKLAEEWKPTLAVLASSWVQEAAHSNTFSKTSSFGSYMERDMYGNIFYRNQRMGGGGRVQAIEPADLMKSQPSDQWAALLNDELAPHFTTVSAQLWLKVNEYEKAFPYIEKLASINPRKAKDLANEFLRVWQRNNNPNSNRNSNSYMFMYGFNTRANSIPLTRSKQERNLRELAKYVERLRALPIGGVDPNLLTQAFVSAHSSAEVYRLETIEGVFGDIKDLDPVVLGDLIGRMRTNLATVWRKPSVQKDAKTRRSQKQMLEQVAQGYATALTLAQESLLSKGRHWALLTAVATLLHDQNNFSMELKRNSNFADVRKGAFQLFEEAADHYASIVPDLTPDEETDQPFTLWFYSALGAADLGAIDESQVVAKTQLSLIKDALANMPDDSRQRHQDRFANLLWTRMSAVKPQIKFRYLQAGFEITGDSEQTKDAQKLWDYYQDLLSELRLDVVVDGDTAVGTEPFGVRVDIMHSEQVGRESGGFQKYATNQNDQAYAFNYGRPTENYRDKFHESAIASLRENFEVLSITFNSEKMEALQDDDPAWQRSPYAYMLLQARGPHVDRIPQLKLDLDFNDLSGFTILPIGSSPVVVDASKEQAARPYSKLEVLQLLDERKLDEGKVTLEIKAKSWGMVPDLDTFLELKTPGFVIKKTDDQGAAVMRFSDDQDSVESERVWLLALEPEDGATPGNFRFGEPTLEGVTAVYQRYNDADLETVSAEVALRRSITASNPVWAWVLLGLSIVGYIVWFFMPASRKGPDAAEQSLRMPEQLTAFSVLALLQKIRGASPLAESQKHELDADLQRIEASHFGKQSADGLELEKIARHWLSKLSKAS
ncbi:MAG: hypothetical protein ACJAUC_000230 [Planctomycetota bacterium]|jgi:hypothetical protein